MDPSKEPTMEKTFGNGQTCQENFESFVGNSKAFFDLNGQLPIK